MNAFHTLLPHTKCLCHFINSKWINFFRDWNNLFVLSMLVRFSLFLFVFFRSLSHFCCWIWMYSFWWHRILATEERIAIDVCFGTIIDHCLIGANICDYCTDAFLFLFSIKRKDKNWFDFEIRLAVFLVRSQNYFSTALFASITITTNCGTIEHNSVAQLDRFLETYLAKQTNLVVVQSIQLFRASLIVQASLRHMHGFGHWRKHVR